MRRWIISIVLALAIAAPTIALAQQGPYNDKQNPYEYTDTEDSQVLKFASYILAPIGYALEWGVARPLHYLATRTPLAPAMSGDTEYSEMYNPGPTIAPIVPGPPPATVTSKSTAPQTYIERTPVGPSAIPAPLAPLTSPPEQPAMH